MSKFAGVFCVLFLLCSVSAHAAASGTPTQGDILRNWFKIYSKDFKKIKSKDLLVTGRAVGGQMLDGLEATGLQTGSTKFSTLTIGLQTALTRLKTDIETLRSKISTTNNQIGKLVNDLRLAAATGTPPQIDTVQTLVTGVHIGLADGVLAAKEITVISESSTAVTGTTGLDPTIATNLRADVTALLVGPHATQSDVDLIKTDLATVGTLLKSEP